MVRDGERNEPPKTPVNARSERAPPHHEAGTNITRPAAMALPERRALGDLLPQAMLATVLFASFVILAHLAVVLWLAWTRGSPGDPALVYTSENFVSVFSDQRTYSVLLDTFAFALVALAVALAFGIPAAWIAERTDFHAKTLL